MKKIAIFALLSAFVATPALADNTGKFYGTLDAGNASFSNSNPGGTSLANPGAVRIGGGYHFSQVFAIEAGYAVLGDSTLIAGTQSATSKNSALQVAAVGTYPVSASFEVFGKLGVSMNSNKLSTVGSAQNYSTSNTSTALMYGIGVQYDVTQQFGIRAQYENFGNFKYSNGNGQSWDVGTTLLSLGVVYNF